MHVQYMTEEFFSIPIFSLKPLTYYELRVNVLRTYTTGSIQHMDTSLIKT